MNSAARIRTQVGIVGAGPIGAYTGMLVYQNADGYRYIIAPMLDGQPTPILRTNYAFRGVAIPAGEHVIEMRFRPSSLVYGGVVSGLSALVVVALAAIGFARSRRAAEGSPARSI